MSTVSTTLGVSSSQTYDFAYVTGLDMEPNIGGFQSNVFSRGKDGYIALTINSISWSTSATLNPATDTVYVNLDISGFDPLTMTQPVDGSNVPLTNYKITSSSGSVTFGVGNPAKYVWVVRNGVVQGSVLNEDNTFTAARLVAAVQPDCAIPAGQPVVFTIDYSLSFVDLTSTIATAVSSAASVANLSVNEANPRQTQVLTASSFASTDSGYVLLALANITTTSVVPARHSDTLPNLDTNPASFFATLSDGTVLVNQYAARNVRSKNLSSVVPRISLIAVNQGKVSRQAELVNSVYNLAKLQLVQGDGDDSATVALTYGISSATI